MAHSWDAWCTGCMPACGCGSILSQALPCPLACTPDHVCPEHWTCPAWQSESHPQLFTAIPSLIRACAAMTSSMSQLQHQHNHSHQCRLRLAALAPQKRCRQRLTCTAAVVSWHRLIASACTCTAEACLARRSQVPQSWWSAPQEGSARFSRADWPSQGTRSGPWCATWTRQRCASCIMKHTNQAISGSGQQR